MNPPRKPLLVYTNSRLGEDFWHYSTPARLTCPGMTDACGGGAFGQPNTGKGACYALRHRFLLDSVKTRLLENYERGRDSKGFVADVVAQVRYMRIRNVRINASGDLFSPQNVLDWHRIAARCRTTKFLFYTRSWRVEGFREPLIALASLPNVFAHWSEDRDTGPCDFPVGRRCFLVIHLQDELLVPPGVLIFRYRTSRVRKFINGSWVCAKEQGTRTAVTCSTCKQCLNRDPWPVASVDRA